MAERMEEEVQDKYKVKESKREAFRGGGGPPGMEEGAPKQQIQNKKVVRRLLGNNFSLFREYNLQRLQSKPEESTEEEEMKQQQRMMNRTDLRRKNQVKRKTGRWEPMVRLLRCQTVRKRGFTQDGKTQYRNGFSGWRRRKRRTRRTIWRKCISTRWRK